MTVRFPREVWQNLRREAFVTERPMNEIVTESVAARYAGKNKVIHHIDGGMGNNDPANPANLRLMDADDHGQPKDTQ